MNGIEKIISRMEADAKAERDAVTAAAQQKAESIRHDYQATADTLQQEAQVRRQAQNAERQQPDGLSPAGAGREAGGH